MGISLTEEEFTALCAACDRVLLLPDSGIECQAIPWLHVIREHPVFLANYTEIFHDNGAVWHSKFARGKRYIANAAYLARQCSRAIATRNGPFFSSSPSVAPVDVLFISHLVNVAHAGSTNDFYFAEIPGELAKMGSKTAVVLLNHTETDGNLLATGWSQATVPRILLNRSIGLTTELCLRNRLLRESRRLRKLADAEPEGLYRKVLARASAEALSSGAWASLRMARQFTELINKYQPKVIVTTYEGHPWERMAYYAAKSVSSEIICIGYQHAALFRLQHAARRKLASQYNPDCILASGFVTKRQLERSPALNGIQLAVLGSCRSIQNKPGENVSFTDSTTNHCQFCLVLPEGDVSECNILFEFSIRCAKALPHARFVWRLHPLLSHEQLAVENPLLRNLPTNIVLSKETLEFDLARCTSALYRGTTAIIQAVLVGLRPLYLARQGEMTIDPLYEVDGWRVTISTVEDFIRVIENDKNLLSRPNEEIKEAVTHCENLFVPINIGILHEIVLRAKASGKSIVKECI